MPPVVDDQGVGDHYVSTAPGPASELRLAHAVADDLAATEFDLIAIHGVITFDFDPSVPYHQAVAGRR